MDSPNNSRPVVSPDLDSPEQVGAEVFSPETLHPQPVIWLRYWYAGLSTPLRLVIAIATIFLVLAIVNAVLHVLASLLLLGILGIIVLTLYRLAIAKS